MTVKNHSKICLIVSASIMVVALILSLCGLGVNYGLDFTGGLSMQYDMGSAFDEADIKTALNGLGIESYTITEQGADTNEVIIRIKEISEDDVQNLQSNFETALAEKYPNLTRSGDVNYVGPVAGKTLLTNAFLSVLIASALMLVYIAIRFDLNSGLAAVFGLVHDVLMMLSFMVLLRNVIQMNSSFIAAMLTIVGYSINATIVIFDRIRENLKAMGKKESIYDVVNNSITQTLTRSIYTSFTTFIMVAILFILGVPSIREFALPLMVGVVCGAYSSVCITGALWYTMKERLMKKEA